jgi:HEAT repeat protein
MRQLSLICTVALLAGCGREWKTAPTVSSLETSLKHEDPKMRYWAARTLGRQGAKAKDAVPALIDRLKNDEDKTVRMGAAYALGDIGPEARPAIPALKTALMDSNQKVRDAATYALKHIQAKKK